MRPAFGAEAMAAHLKLLIAGLKHDRFGASSERGRKRIDPLELERGERVASASEDATAAEAAAGRDKAVSAGRRQPTRAPLPEHLPRRARGHPGARRRPLPRRPACQAGRGHHRAARGCAAPVEGDPDRAGAVLLPLSDAALAVLRAMEPHEPDDGNAFVFPGAAKGKALSSMAMLTLLRRMKRADLTVHGFRSTFRDRCEEATSTPRAVAEAALAHAIGDKVEAAHSRGAAQHATGTRHCGGFVASR
jgi:integrase